MKKLMTLIGGVGCLALQACAAGEVVTTETVAFEHEGVSGTMTLRDWGGVYCADFVLQNGMGVTANKLNLAIGIPHGTLQPGGTNGYNSWGMAFNGMVNGKHTFKETSGSTVGAGANKTAGFCVNTAPGMARPTFSFPNAGWNMSATVYNACSTNSGLHPTRASLAVAMGAEMGRWSPSTDLQVGGNGRVEVSPTGLSRCTNGCAQTKAILSLQDPAIASSVDQNTFNPTVFKEDMKASFDRQRSKIDDLTRNNPGSLPPAHKLTLVGGPVNLGIGSCGPHFIYAATDLNNVPLTQTQANNLANALCYYGQGSCGANPYIGYLSNSVPGCPAGQMCIAIDPIEGDNSGTGGTTETGMTNTGSITSYPRNIYQSTSYTDWLSKQGLGCYTAGLPPAGGVLKSLQCSATNGCNYSLDTKLYCR